MGENQFRVRINAGPKPIIAAFRFIIFGACQRARRHIAIARPSRFAARQVAQLAVHVIGESLSGFPNDAQNRMNAHAEHSRDRVEWSALAQRCQN